MDGGVGRTWTEEAGRCWATSAGERRGHVGHDDIHGSACNVGAGQGRAGKGRWGQGCGRKLYTLNRLLV
jgi:hypothetical protein